MIEIGLQIFTVLTLYPLRGCAAGQAAAAAGAALSVAVSGLAWCST
jgi:hypothetical protein